MGNKNPPNKKTNEQFIEQVYNLVKNEYIFLEDYINSQVKIKVIHNIDNCKHEYYITPSGFLSGSRCPKCFENNRWKLKAKKHETFCKEVYNLVKNEYEVISKYTIGSEKILIKHNICSNTYPVRPYDFLAGCRCPICRQSKGEKIIINYLSNNNINYLTEYKFKDCRNKLPLPFDFAVFDKDDNLNYLIEYDGIQHYKDTGWENENAKLERTQHNDNIKNQYCKNNNIILIRIPYWDFDNVEDILNKELIFN